MEQGQSIDTVANAISSVEAALGVAASLPLQGLGAQLGADSLQQAAGSIAALERIPRLVGFADQSETDGAYFGWAVSPKATLDPERNAVRLEQTFTTFRTSAEVAVPGWWPYVYLDVESYWAGGFGNEDGFTYDGDNEVGSKRRRLVVDLPTTSVDYDGLTKFIIGDMGPRGEVFLQPDVTSITPEAVSACANDVTFVIRGKNVWRGSEVYVGGLPASEVKVLPDMEGLSVKVNVPELLGKGDTFALGEESVQLPLVIATRDGLDHEQSISVVFPRNIATRASCTSNLIPNVVDQTPTTGLRISRIEPETAYMCGETLHISARLEKTDWPFYDDPDDGVQANLGGIPADRVRVGRSINSVGGYGYDHVIQTEFRTDSLPKEDFVLPFTVYGGGSNIDTMNVELKTCPGRAGSND